MGANLISWIDFSQLNKISRTRDYYEMVRSSLSRFVDILETDVDPTVNVACD